MAVAVAEGGLQLDGEGKTAPDVNVTVEKGFKARTAAVQDGGESVGIAGDLGGGTPLPGPEDPGMPMDFYCECAG